MDKAQDKETDILFTKEDVARIIKDIKDEDLREKLQKERDKRLFRGMDEALKEENHEKFDRLMKDLHTPRRTARGIAYNPRFSLLRSSSCFF